ncbi:MAG: GNAT family N-acetyltransferase [Intestinimonas sp.]|jgi:ribosomal protein S18 acetylase RimI-like enzyme|nr:GNAT family N-acetyltransferase [Intestinimonas sp.]
MQYGRKTVPLKNGQRCLLKSPDEGDAQAVLACLKQVSGETDYLPRSVEEVTMTEGKAHVFLLRMLNRERALMISAVVEGELVANSILEVVAPYMRQKHRAALTISVKKDYWGLGIGKILVSAMIEAARHMDYEQMEVEVASENRRAVRLFEQFGFETYGIRERSSRHRDGHYSSDRLMFLRL